MLDHILCPRQLLGSAAELILLFQVDVPEDFGKFLLPGPASWQAPTLHLAARQLLVVGEEVAVPLVDLACPVKGCALH